MPEPTMSSLPRAGRSFAFSSPPPRVRLVHAFDRPFENVVATARTCYSPRGIVTEDQASARPEQTSAASWQPPLLDIRIVRPSGFNSRLTRSESPFARARRRR